MEKKSKFGFIGTKTFKSMITVTLMAAMALIICLIPIKGNVAHAAAPAGYTLKWTDEFNGTSVDTSLWNFRTDTKALSAQRAQNVTEGGGVMSINLKKETFNGMSYTGGGLISKQAFRYGYYETRAKANPGAGWHDSFWAMKGDGSTTFGTDRSTELDGFEINTGALSTNANTIHRWNPDGTDSPISGASYNMGFDSSAAFHVYGMEWTETNFYFYVDGVLKTTLSYPSTSHNHDMINIWLTDIAYMSPVNDTLLPATADFDYIRFYERDVYIDNGETGYTEPSGTWNDSTLQGYSLSSSRYSATAGAFAKWTPNLLSAANYHVYIYKVADVNSDTNGQIDVVHNGTTTTQSVDFTSGSSGWVDLGSYYFPAGTAGYVMNTRSNNNARADMVKFVYEGTGTTLFSDDFEAGNSAKWTVVTGTWSVVTDGTNVFKQTNNAISAIAYAGTSTWTDYTVQSRIKLYDLNTLSGSGILARYVDSNNFYMLRLHQSGKVQLYKNIAGTYTLLQEAMTTVSTNTWYTLKLVMSGTTLTGYVDGALKVSAADSSLASGRIGVRSYNETFSIDDVKVTN